MVCETLDIVGGGLLWCIPVESSLSLRMGAPVLLRFAADRRTLGILARAIDSLINTQGIGDLYRIYLTTQRDRIDYNLAFIGRDFNEVLPSAFDSAYMRALYDYAYQRARRGYDWAKKPPIA